MEVKGKYFLRNFLFSDLTSSKLKTKTLYFEKLGERYELSVIAKPTKDNDIFSEDQELYRLSKLKKPFEYDNQFFSIQNVPLNSEFVNVNSIYIGCKG